MRFGHWLVGLLCVVLTSGSGYSQEDLQDTPAVLSFKVGVNEVSVSGVVSSAAHEEILRQTVQNRFNGKSPVFSVAVRPALPPGWALITDITLRALAETRTSSANLTPIAIEIDGFTEDPEGWQAALVRVRNNALPGMTVSQRIIEVGTAGSINRQCIELFRTAMRGRRIEFPRASAELGTAATPLLDELIQIAVDCPDMLIEVTGHTDSLGDETVNLALSQARANSIAAYMIAGGIASTRINATGVGSARPLAEETSAQARQLNRRIEIDVRFP